MPRSSPGSSQSAAVGLCPLQPLSRQVAAVKQQAHRHDSLLSRSFAISPSPVARCPLQDLIRALQERVAAQAAVIAQQEGTILRLRQQLQALSVNDVRELHVCELHVRERRP